MDKQTQPVVDVVVALKATQEALRLVESCLPIIESGVRENQIAPEEHLAVFDFLAKLAAQNPYK